MNFWEDQTRKDWIGGDNKLEGCNVSCAQVLAEAGQVSLGMI